VFFFPFFQVFCIIVGRYFITFGLITNFLLSITNTGALVLIINMFKENESFIVERSRGQPYWVNFVVFGLVMVKIIYKKKKCLSSFFSLFLGFDDCRRAMKNEIKQDDFLKIQNDSTEFEENIEL
jgi:hypothetical protein